MNDEIHAHGDDATHPGKGRSDSPGRGPSRPIDPLVVSTTDPAVAAEAEHQSDWKRHPLATIRLETTPAGRPELLPVASPWALDLGSARRIEPEPPPSQPEPAERHPEPVSEAHDGCKDPEPDDEPVPAASRDLAAASAHRRPRNPGSWYPWVVAGAALLGGVIGSVAYLSMIGPRGRRGS